MLKQKLEFEGHLHTVKQAIDYLSAVSVEDYQQVLAPYFCASAGAHMRHILDHYIALQQGLKTHTINYNTRHRHNLLERCPESAITQWREIETWLCDLSEIDAGLSLSIICETSIETSIESTNNSVTQSTLGRELLFISSHAIHHFSLLAIIGSLQGQAVQTNFGLAPATASFRRQSA
jgi:hypothetical protein